VRQNFNRRRGIERKKNYLSYYKKYPKTKAESIVRKINDEQSQGRIWEIGGPRDYEECPGIKDP
jgi:hypothetical protein